MRQRIALLLVVLAVALTLGLLWGVQDARVMRLEAPRAGVVEGVPASGVATDITTEKPQFSGEDAKGRKWQLNAEEATQSGTVSDSTLTLSRATGWWQSGPTLLTGQAQKGDYRPERGSLKLSGGVVLQNSDTVIHTPALTADMTTQQISGTDGVSLTRELNTQTLQVQAQQFTVDPATQKVTLKGRVKARLEPK